MFALFPCLQPYGRKTRVSFYLSFLVILAGLLTGNRSSAQSAYSSNVLSLGPVAYWRLNETVTPNPGPVTAVDASTNSFNGTYGTGSYNSGSTYPYTAFGPTPPTFPGFETNNGAVATINSQNNSWVTVPALNLNTNVVTMTAWIYPVGNQVQGSALFFWRGTNAGDNTAGLIYNNLLNNNNLAYNWGSGSGPYFWLTGLIPPVNVWSLVALVVTPTNATIYLMNQNGLSIASTNISNVVLPFNTPANIGTDPYSTSRNFNGSIDEVAIFNQALTEFQLADLYKSGSGVVFSPNIAQQPYPEAVYAGRNAQFSAQITGLPAFYYQWSSSSNGGTTFNTLSDGGAVSGSTNSSLTIANVNAGTPKLYRLVVSNVFGATTSSVAPLTIVPPPTSTFVTQVDTNQPVAYWRLNETNNPNPGPAYAYDYYGGYTGIYGVNTSNGFNNIGGPSKPGWPGFETNNDALETFYGVTNSDVTVPALNLNTNALTVSMWIYPLGGQFENVGLFVWRGSNGSAGFVYNGAVFDDNLAYNWGNASTPYTWVSGIAPPANLWSFVSLVVTSTNATIYMMNTNGLSSASITYPNPVMPFDSPANIGTDPYSDYRTFNGLIDEVAVYNRSLSLADLNSIYVAGAGLWPGLAPSITQPPGDSTLYTGKTATFSVAVSGLAPFTYRWYTTNASGNFVALTDTNGVSGSTNTTLTISNVTPSTPEEYEVTISNSYGVITSAVVTINLLGSYTSPDEAAIINNSPVGYWRLNEKLNPNPGPVSAADSSGNNLDGTYGVNTGNYATGVNGPLPPAFAGFESTNGALQTFAGQDNSYVTVPALNLNTNTVTISLWVYPQANQNPGAALFFWRGSSAAGLIYNDLVGNNQLAYNWGPDSGPYDWQTGLAPPYEMWSFLALVVTPTNATIYMINANGLSMASTNIANAVLPFDSPSTIGSDTYANSRTFTGTIDDVAVFNQALTEPQVAAIYTAAAGQLFSPIITAQPSSEELYPGKTGQFSVSVIGATPFTYQWFTTNGSGGYTPLTDGGNISGSTNSTLVLSGVTTNNPARYRVVITNAIGAVTSTVASLTIAPASKSAYEQALDAINPVAYWRLDDNTAPNPGPAYAYDYFGGYAGLYGVNTSNAANGILGPSAPAFPGFETNNGALETFGNVTNSYVTVPALNLNTNTVTISMWIYPQGTQAQNTGLFFWRGGNGAGLTYSGAAANNNLAYDWGDNPAQYNWNSGVVPPTNVWSLVSLVITPSNAVVYLMNTNGLSIATNNVTNANIAFNGPSDIGTDPYQDSRTFNGIIDEVAVFNQALTFSQLNTLYLAAAGSWPALQPKISQQPNSPTLSVGRQAQFTVGVSGYPPLVYQWMTTNGSGAFVPMTDGNGVSGTSTTSLTISNVALTTPAQYEVVITNAYGAATSSVARLTVVTGSVTPYAQAVGAAGPVAYWRLNETQNPSPGPTAAYDYYGGFSGTYGVNAQNAFNGVTGPTAPGWPGFETNNGALETYNGVTNSFVSVPALNLNTNNVTISMWIYPQDNQVPNTGLFFWRGSDSAGLIYSGSLGGQNNLAYNWGSSSGPYLWVSGLVPPQNLWSLISLVVTPTNATIYMMNTNGLSSASTNMANAVMAFDGPSDIGTDPYQDNRTFNGKIDEVAIFNQALTEPQINAIYISGAGLWPGLAPSITQQPAPTTLYAGRNAQFNVAVSGLAPFAYQWYTTNGAGSYVPLTDGGNITGSTNASLMIDGVSNATPEQYIVIVSNFYGMATSTVAYLNIAPAETEAGPLAVETNVPVAYWRLNETTPPNPGPAYAYDYYGGFSGLYAVNSSNAAEGVRGPLAPAYPGMETNNGALETFNSVTNSEVTVPALNLNTNTVTISMWIYPLGNQVPNTGLFFWRGSSSAGFIYSGSSAANTLAYNWGNSATPYLWNSGLVVPTNLWSFVALVVSPTNATVYLINTNGRASASLAFSNANMAFDGPSVIGTDPYQDNRTFNGIIDEVAVYNHDLTQSQLNAIYVASAGPWLQFEPIITQQPVPATLYAGRSPQFTVGVTGLMPFSYQWLTTNGSGQFVPLSDGNGISGSSSQTLMVSNVSTATPAQYEVVVTNQYGSATSTVATLNIVASSAGAYSAAIQSNQPFAFWQLNETNVDPATGTAPAYDYDGGFTGEYGTNSFDGGSPSPDTVFGPTPPAFPGFATNNGALETFSGSDSSYVTVPALNLNTNVVTCCMWINPQAVQQPDTGLFVCRGGTTVAGFGYSHSVPNTLAYNWANDYHTYLWSSELSPPTNLWSFVSWVVTSTNITVYMMNSNGLAFAELDYPNSVQAFDWPSTIGSDSYTNIRTFTGEISDVTLFNHALTENQIAALFVAGSALSFPPQIAVQPLSPTLYAGRNAQFTAGVASAAPFAYQWLTTNGSGGNLLVSSGTGPAGTNLVNLVVPNISNTTPTKYEVVATNIFGAVTSSVATLTVVSPGTLGNFEKAVASNQPIAFWRLDETNINPATGSAPAYDYYGGFTGNYGVNTWDGATPSPNKVASPPFSGIANGGALETFTGSNNSYVTVPPMYLNANTLTCTAWLYPIGTEGQDVALIFCRGGSTVAGFGYGNIFADQLGYTWDNAPASFNWISGLTLPSNVWSLASWVLTPTNLNIYVLNANGVTNATYANPNPVQAFDAPSTIGSDIYSTTRTFNGMISDLALFGQALSTAQLTNLYAAGGTNLSGSGPTYLPVSLRINLAGTNVVLSWSSTAGPYILQVNPSLSPGGWSPVTNTPVTANGTNQVTAPLPTNAQFYRLSSP
jgi:hypothetical protein